MRPLRSLLLALAVVALASPLATEPAWAQAAEPIPDTGLVEFLPSGTVVGDGATTTRLYVVAIGPTGAPRRWRAKNGYSIDRRYHALVDWPNVISPVREPSPRAQAPCVHGPIARCVVVEGLWSRSARYARSGPARSSASYQPPTTSTAGVTLAK